MPSARVSDGHEGEARVAAHRAQGVADVLLRLIEPREGPPLPRLLPHRGHVPEPPPGRVRRLLRGRPARHRVPLEALPMEAQLVRELAVERVASQPVPRSRHPLAQGDHAGRITRPIAAISSAKPASSAPSWRLPAGGDGVVAGPLVVGRLPPLGLDPALLPHPLERRIERPLLHLEHLARHPVEVLRDAVAVHGLHGQRLEDEHVEQPREQLALRRTVHAVAMACLGDRQSMATTCGRQDSAACSLGNDQMIRLGISA